MAKLFKTPEELIKGYGLPMPDKRGRRAGRSEQREVTLRARILLSGNVQLYLYACNNGKAIRRACGVLNIETSQAVKASNNAVFKFAVAEAGERNSQAIRTGHGFNQSTDTKIKLVDYIQHLIDKKRISEGNHYAASLIRHLNISGFGGVRLADISSEWCIKFVKYLRNDALNLNYKYEEKKLSQNRQSRFFIYLNTTLKNAVADGLIPSNPADKVSKQDKPQEQESTRTYLDMGEVRRLSETQCGNEQVKRAFMFSCFTGLRVSDIRLLRWCDIKEDDNGKYIAIIMKKTRRRVKVYLSNIATRQMTKRGVGDDYVFSLPVQTNVNRVLKRWCKKANIDKYVTFHTARHTFATVMLNADVPIEVVSRMLGHHNISTTEIYAKILNKTVATAITKQDEIFG